MLRDADGSAYLYSRTPENTSEGIADQVATGMLEMTEPQVLDVVPGPARGLQRGLAVPVKIDDRIVGVLALFSRNPQGFNASDLCHAQRLAHCLGLALAYREAGSARRDRSPAAGTKSRVRRAAPDDLRRPRHPHRVSARLEHRQEDASA